MKSTKTITEPSKALELMLNGENVFLSGEEGTGKEAVIYQFRTLAYASNVVYLTHSVEDAYYYQGQTIQSFFQLPDRALYLDEEPLPVISKSLMSFYRSVDTIIIDEVSKLSSDVFYAMNIRLRQAAYDTEYKGIPFAGKQIIVLDDPTQKSRLRLGKAEQKYVKDTFGVLYASQTSLWEDLNFKRVQFHEEDHSRFKK